MVRLFIVSVSGGLGSSEALRRAIEKHGVENVRGVFADVGSVYDDYGNKVCGEDDDLYRFLSETEQFLGIEVTRLKSEKYNNIWDAFFGERMLGSTLRDPCSRWLKRRVIDDWIRANFLELQIVRALGFSWLEKARAESFDKAIGLQTWHPLLEPPYLTSDDIAAWWEARGIRRPRLYVQGYAHNNCGGFCVKMGLGQARDLLLLNRPAYIWHEEQEERFRREINAEATIFHRNKAPITMRQLRAEFEAGFIPKTNKQSCGGRCMIPGKYESDRAIDEQAEENAYFLGEEIKKRKALEAAG